METSLKISVIKHPERDELYCIHLYYKHSQFSMDLRSYPMRKEEADARAIRMIADLNAENDGLISLGDK